MSQTQNQWCPICVLEMMNYSRKASLDNLSAPASDTSILSTVVFGGTLIFGRNVSCTFSGLGGVGQGVISFVELAHTADATALTIFLFELAKFSVSYTRGVGVAAGSVPHLDFVQSFGISHSFALNSIALRCPTFGVGSK